MHAGKRLIQLFALFAAVVAAGCVSQLGDWPIFGEDVIKTQLVQERPNVADVVVMENARSLPDKIVLPGEEVNFFINIVSKETDPLRIPANTFFEVFDATQFRNTKGKLCNTINGGCKPEDNVCTKDNKCQLRAGEIVALEMRLLAPTEEQIARVKTPSTLNYRLVYDYESTTNFEVLLVTREEIIRLQQEGRTLQMPLRHSSTTGPLQVQISTAGGSGFGIQGQKMFVKLKVTNIGSGSPINNKIETGELQITFPKIGDNCKITPQKEFASGNAVDAVPCGSDGAKITNTARLTLLKGETIEYLFQIDAGNLPPGVPHQTFIITAKVNYQYELRGSHTLDVVPQQIS